MILEKGFFYQKLIITLKLAFRIIIRRLQKYIVASSIFISSLPNFSNKMNDRYQNYLSTISELYNRIEALNFSFPKIYEELIINYFKPIDIICSIGKGFFPIIKRVSINKRIVNENIRIFEVEKLKYPPSNCVTKFGRANLKKQSVFYGAFNLNTAIKELKPETGDLITVSEWRLRNENMQLIVCPFFIKQPEDFTTNIRLLEIYYSFLKELNRFPEDISTLVLEIHKFYAKVFSRKIDLYNNQGYLFSALLADKIFHQYKQGIVDAILYPSIQDEYRTENIAVKKDSFDQKYTLFRTIEKKVIDHSIKTDKYRFEEKGESKIIEERRIQWT